MLGSKEHEVLAGVEGIFVLQKFQVNQVTTLCVNLREHGVGVDAHALPALRSVDRRNDARTRRRRWNARRGSRYGRSGHCGCGRPKLLLPRFPKKQQREREYEEEDQTLSVHEGSRQLRDRIMATWVPRMAPRKAGESKPRAVHRAVALEGLQRVLRARRMETAVHPEQWAESVTITSNQGRQQPAHDDPTRHRSTSASPTLTAVK